MAGSRFRATASASGRLLLHATIFMLEQPRPRNGRTAPPTARLCSNPSRDCHAKGRMADASR